MTEAFAEGYLAFQNGWTLRNNPYAADECPEWQEWERGWLQAQEDLKQ